jgi:CRISPR-associated protein Csd1
MGWMRDLVDTYERCLGAPNLYPPLPTLYHIAFNCHLEVVLDSAGKLREIRQLDPPESIEVPVTEDSGTRSGSLPKPHPLFDKLAYIAGDLEAVGGKALLHDEYLALLAGWAQESGNAKLLAVLSYVSSNRLGHDLLTRGIIERADSGELRRRLDGESKRGLPGILKLVAQPEDAVVRWCVEIEGDPEPRLWADAALKRAWVDRAVASAAKPGLCMVTGEQVTALASKHPKGTVKKAFHAKLISQNDDTGFTYRGRFHDAEQAVGIGLGTSQKAHAALRWLVERQGHIDMASAAAFVTWTPSGADLPSLDASTAELAQRASGDDLDMLLAVSDVVAAEAERSDVGERYASALRLLLSGYSARLQADEAAVVMSIAPSTPGRMAVTLYRRLAASDFLQRVMRWHEIHAWKLRPAYDESRSGTRLPAFFGAPSPMAVVKAAFGDKVKGGRARKAKEGILTALLRGAPVPDAVTSAAVRRAFNRSAFGVSPRDTAQYNELFSVACALYRGLHHTEGFCMTLERERKTRSYLFGRLLAIAHKIETDAMYVSGEPLKRLSSAERLLPRYQLRPMTTLQNINIKLMAYRKRLAAKNSYRLSLLNKEWTAVMGLFDPGDFNDQRLTGEMLLGYATEIEHLVEALRRKPPTPDTSADSDAAAEEIV